MKLKRPTAAGRELGPYRRRVGSGGVGFTMAIFVTNLAFVDPKMIAMAESAILAASLIAGIADFFILRAVTDEEDEEPVR